MKSWRTTLAGFLTAAGLYIVSDVQPGETVWKRAGQLMAIGGSALMGLSARDNKVTSEQAGAK